MATKINLIRVFSHFSRAKLTQGYGGGEKWVFFFIFFYCFQKVAEFHSFSCKIQNLLQHKRYHYLFFIPLKQVFNTNVIYKNDIKQHGRRQQVQTKLEEENIQQQPGSGSHSAKVNENFPVYSLSDYLDLRFIFFLRPFSPFFIRTSIFL